MKVLPPGVPPAWPRSSVPDGRYTGGTPGGNTFIGFDTKQRRGVVVLSNQKNLHSSTIGWAILQRMPLTRDSGTEFIRKIVGLGMALGLDPSTHLVRINKVYPKSPAGQAGVSTGTLIQRINGIPVEGKTLPECLQLLAGPIGTKIRLELVKPDRRETNTVELVRQKFLTSG